MGHPSKPEFTGRRPIIKVFKGSWFRIHRLAYGPVHFGRVPTNPFDAPAGEYGVLYAARDVAGAFAETLTHDTGVSVVAEHDLRIRGLAEVSFTRPLRLVDLRAEGLARLGADASLAGGPQADYPICRLWSQALHDHPRCPDGIAYRPRHDPRRTCVALFERVAPELRFTSVGRSLIDPVNFPRIERILERYGVGLV